MSAESHWPSSDRRLVPEEAGELAAINPPSGTVGARRRSSPMLMGWNAFTATHTRPFIVFADIPERGGVRGAGGRQNKFALLGPLLTALQLGTNYALMPEAKLFRVAFAHEEAARTFVDTMLARKTAREGGWAGQWVFAYDDAMVAKIKAMLPPPEKRMRRAMGRQP